MPNYQSFTKGWDLARVLKNLPTAMGKAENLGKLVGEFQLTLSLLQDYASGKYRNVSGTTIALLVAAAAYVICPLDAVPDILPFLGFGDDIAFFGAALLKVRSELEPYKEWKREQKRKQNQEQEQPETQARENAQKESAAEESETFKPEV